MDAQKAAEPGAGRRSFLKKSAVGAAVVAGMRLTPVTAGDLIYLPEEKAPWYRRITRWGQINITENDPPRYDIPWWRKFWKETHTQGVVVNAGGIVAYYPTQIPLQHKATYLGDRDLFGEISRAAHEDGLVVFARMDSSRAHEDLYKAHPDWFARDRTGNPLKAAELYLSCVNSPYYEEYIPSIMREIIAMYHPEGFTDNSWSGLGRDTICYCENCQKKFRDKTGKHIPLKKDWDDAVYRQWIRWNYDRRIELWELNNRVTKSAGGPQCIWAGMNSGSVSSQSHTFRDYKEICKRADLIMLDNQSRSDFSGFQHNGDIGKQLHGLLGWDKLVPESMALYQSGRPTFRLASKPPAEARMWMLEGFAGGIQPWWHMVSAYHEDRRMYHTADPVLQWYSAHEQYLVHRTPVATVGVVWSQDNNDYYGRDAARELVDMPWQGVTEALIRAKIPYLPVHADHIDRDAGLFSLLVLPNVALMTDSQLAAVRRFADQGGSIVATGQTSLYDESGTMREDYALGDLWGVHLEAVVRDAIREQQGNNTHHTYLRLTPELRSQMRGPHEKNEPPVTGKRHPILKGFEQTDIFPYGGLLWPLKVDADAQVLMTFIPEFPIYPPETAWMRTPKTDIPGLILKETSSGGRIVFLPADIDRQFSRYNLPDHGDLLKNIFLWAVKDNLPLKAEGTGLIDYHLYRQEKRLILHIIHLTNAATWRAPIHELIASGPIKLQVKIPSGLDGAKVQSFVSRQSITPRVENGWSHFTVNAVLDHELLVIGQP
jgi:hypothetical protein